MLALACIWNLLPRESQTYLVYDANVNSWSQQLDISSGSSRYPRVLLSLILFLT